MMRGGVSGEVFCSPCLFAALWVIVAVARVK
jgi:hypothetical protein